MTGLSSRPDGRQHPRFAVTLDAQVQIGNQTLPAQTKDMSRSGICVVCNGQSAPGSTIRLFLALSLGAGAFSENLELTARVIWCTPVDRRFQLGAVFSNLDAEKRGFLEMFLRFLQQEITVGTDAASPESQFDTGDEDEP